MSDFRKRIAALAISGTMIAGGLTSCIPEEPLPHAPEGYYEGSYYYDETEEYEDRELTAEERAERDRIENEIRNEQDAEAFRREQEDGSFDDRYFGP